MKKVKQKNQIIITVLALLIAVSGYLHFANEGAKGIEAAVSNVTQTPENDEIETSIGQISAKDIEDSTKSKAPEATKSTDEDKEGAKNTEKPVEATKKSETDILPDSATVGQAVLVNTTINADYFYSAKLGREQVRAKNTETLMDIVNNKDLSDKQKESAAQEIINITKAAQLENDIENLLAAKGYENCVVSIGEKNADVIVDISSITLEQAAVIEDVVIRKTGFSSGNIVITPINGE